VAEARQHFQLRPRYPGVHVSGPADGRQQPVLVRREEVGRRVDLAQPVAQVVVAQDAEPAELAVAVDGPGPLMERAQVFPQRVGAVQA